MATPGPVIHQQLMDAYAALQAELENERAKIVDVRKQRDEIDQRRSDTLAELAEHYLPDLSNASIEQTWSEVQSEIHSLLLRQQDHARRLNTQCDQLKRNREERERQLAENRQLLDQALAKQQQVIGQVEQRLRSDPEFVRLTDRAAVAEAALERAESNLAEIDQDAARKLPAYDKSSLFRYLYDRGFGSEQYQQTGFTRRMDRALARFIDFTEARNSYDFLKRTPDQMRKLIAEDRAALDVVMDELERRRDRVAEEMNLPELLRDTEQLTQQRDRQLDDLRCVNEQLGEAETELTDVDDPRGPYYREAIELFRKTLEKIDPEQLDRRARQTAELTDDQIVARLHGVKQEREQLDEATRQRRQELDQQYEFLSGLGKVIQRFRAAQFDAARSHFIDSLDLAAEIEQARNYHQTGHLWKRIRAAQRWGEVRSDDSSGSTASPMSQLLVNAMGQASQQTHGPYARRAGDRRAQRNATAPPNVR